MTCIDHWPMVQIDEHLRIHNEAPVKVILLYKIYLK